jgi:opacity protein-like surface antigen
MVRLHRVTAALALLLSGAAQAADMPSLPLPPPIPVTPVAPVHWLSAGWYLRGDLGYHWGAISSADSAAPFPDPVDSKLGNGFLAGIGAGIKTNWLRTDFTLDYIAPVKYTGRAAAPDDTSARVQINTLLFNGYFDLGTWYRLTPYVGAGAGVGYVRAYDYQSTAAPPFGADTDKNQWRFAWAAMAGVGWQVAPNLVLDVGYRYLNVGDVKTGDGVGGPMTFKNVAGHEARVGLRWSFDDIRVYP